MNTTKQLLARVWKPLLRKFGEKIDAACLRRDAFLDHVLAHEAQALRTEVPRNSPEARAYLQELLGQLDRQPVNFTVSAETFELVNKACKEQNVLRDCFVNRVLFLLLANLSTIEAIAEIKFDEVLPGILESHDRDYLYRPLWAGGLRAVSEIVASDPFNSLRKIIEDTKAEPLHSMFIPPWLLPDTPGILALNCYLPKESIPGSPAAARLLTELEELLGEAEKTKPRRAESKDRKDQTP